MRNKQNLRYAVVIAAGALVYFFLAGFLIAQLSHVAIPSQWLVHWSSRATGVLAWLQGLNVLACLCAALPVALTIVWAIPAYRTLVAFAASTLTATMVVARLFDSEMSPTRNADLAYWVNFAVLSLAFLLAVPLWVSAVSALARVRR